MKKSTYIMFTLIIAGVLLMSSFVAFVRCAGEKQDPWWKYRQSISAMVDSMTLPQFESVKIKFTPSDDTYGHFHVANGLHYGVKADDDITEPFIQYPSTFKDSVFVSVDSALLTIDFKCEYPFYERGDESGDIILHIPASMDLKNYSVDMNGSSGELTVTGLVQDEFNACIPNIGLVVDKVKLDDISVDFGSIDVYRSADISVFESDIDQINIYSRKDVNFAADSLSTVNMANLGGADVEYILTGIEHYKARPDRGMSIVVSQKYIGN